VGKNLSKFSCLGTFKASSFIKRGHWHKFTKLIKGKNKLSKMLPKEVKVMLLAKVLLRVEELIFTEQFATMMTQFKVPYL